MRDICVGGDGRGSGGDDDDDVANHERNDAINMNLISQSSEILPSLVHNYPF